MLDWKGREFCQFSKLTLLAAHRDTHFAFIKQAKVGDMITLDRLSGPRATYRVTGFKPSGGIDSRCAEHSRALRSGW